MLGESRLRYAVSVTGSRRAHQIGNSPILVMGTPYLMLCCINNIWTSSFKPLYEPCLIQCHFSLFSIFLCVSSFFNCKYPSRTKSVSQSTYYRFFTVDLWVNGMRWENSTSNGLTFGLFKLYILVILFYV